MRVSFRIVRQVVPVVVCLSIALPVAVRGDDGGKSVVRSSTSSSGEQHGHFFAYVAPLTPKAAVGDIFDRPQPQSNTRLVQFGGGGEATVGRVFGIGTDFGGIPNATTGSTAAVISVNGYVHAPGVESLHLDPYLTAGFSGFFFPVHQLTGGPNLGAGVNWWFRGSVGLAVELRQTYGATSRELRFGVVVRQ